MSSFSARLLQAFQTRENKQRLYTLVCAKYTDTTRRDFVRTNMNELIASYSKLIEIEFAQSTPLPGIDLAQYVAMYNRSFVDGLDDLFGHDKSAQPVRVSDGYCATRGRVDASPNATLESWGKPRGTFGLRDDHVGDREQRWRADDACGAGAIDFYDVRAEGVNRHVDQFGGAYFDVFNPGPLRRPEGRVFGTDDEIMGRRIFRKNEQGVENGFDQPRISAQRRPQQLFNDVRVDAGVDRETYQYKQDMGALYERTDKLGAARRARVKDWL